VNDCSDHTLSVAFIVPSFTLISMPTGATAFPSKDHAKLKECSVAQTTHLFSISPDPLAKRAPFFSVCKSDLLILRACIKHNCSNYVGELKRMETVLLTMMFMMLSLFMSMIMFIF
jgi:hypothetical protein